jgi:hypothetical protein
MELEKLSHAKHGLPADVHADNHFHFPRKRDAAPPAAGGIVANTADFIAPAATGRTNVDETFPAFQVGLIRNQSDRVAAPAKKFGVVADANDFFGLVVYIVYSENKCLPS